jgi:hypothetical protein
MALEELYPPHTFGDTTHTGIALSVKSFSFTCIHRQAFPDGDLGAVTKALASSLQMPRLKELILGLDPLTIPGCLSLARLFDESKRITILYRGEVAYSLSINGGGPFIMKFKWEAAD